MDVLKKSGVAAIAGPAKGDYPREDVCRCCAAHIGWVLAPIGEIVALGVCEDCAETTDASA